MVDRRIDAWWSKLDVAQCQAALARCRLHGPLGTAQWVHEEYKMPTPSRAAMYRFYAWARQQESAWNLHKALTDKGDFEQILAKTGNIDEVNRKGLALLLMDAQVSRDPDRINKFAGAFAMVSDVALKTRKLDLEVERFRAKLKSDLEKGLDALMAEVKGNAKAEQLVLDLQTQIARPTEAAA